MFKRYVKVTKQNKSVLWGHTIGTYFRLLADEILDPSVVPHVVYMDTDVVIMENLDTIRDLLQKDNITEKYFSWGVRQCAGVMHINLATLPTIWQLFEDASDAEYRAVHETYDLANDQSFLRTIILRQPDKVGRLSDTWDAHAADVRKYDQKFDKVSNFPSVSMLHHNGGKYYHDVATTDLEDTYWKVHIVHHNSKNQIRKYEENWRLSLFFVHMPWHWAKHHASINCLFESCHYGVNIQFYNPMPREE